MGHFQFRETVQGRSLRCEPAIIVNNDQLCVQLIVSRSQVGDEMATRELGMRTDALKIGAAVTVLAAEALAAILLLAVVVG